MATADICNSCGKVAVKDSLPPTLEPVQIVDATTTTYLLLCDDCKKPVVELQALGEPSPNEGSVRGLEKLTWMFRPDPGDDSAPPPGSREGGAERVRKRPRK